MCVPCPHSPLFMITGSGWGLDLLKSAINIILGLGGVKKHAGGVTHAKKYIISFVYSSS